MGRAHVLNPEDVVSGPPIKNPSVVDIQPLEEHRLRILLKNGEVRLFDLKPYLEVKVFQSLRESEIFRKAWVEAGSVE